MNRLVMWGALAIGAGVVIGALILLDAERGLFRNARTAVHPRPIVVAEPNPVSEPHPLLAAGEDHEVRITAYCLNRHDLCVHACAVRSEPGTCTLFCQFQQEDCLGSTSIDELEHFEAHSSDGNAAPVDERESHEHATP